MKGIQSFFHTTATILCLLYTLLGILVIKGAMDESSLVSSV
jgi:hypothetical protein